MWVTGGVWVICAKLPFLHSLHVRIDQDMNQKTRTKQPDNFLSTVFENNEHGRSFLVFVGLRQRGC